jgi:rod shape-determining protein MreD
VRVALAIVVPLAAALLQGSVVPFIAVGGARPNLVILVAAAWAVAAGAREAVWWAFLGGIAVDLLSGGPLGAAALSALVAVAALGLADGRGRPRSVPGGALLVALATFGAGLVYLGILAVAGATLGDLPSLVTAVVASALYNGVLAIATYPLLRTLGRATEKQASFSRQPW